MIRGDPSLNSEYNLDYITFSILKKNIDQDLCILLYHDAFLPYSLIAVESIHDPQLGLHIVRISDSNCLVP